jgi:signal transduction histidine kinase
MNPAPSIRKRIILLHLAAFMIMSAAIIGAAFLLLHATVDRFEQDILRLHADTVGQYLSYEGEWKLSLPPRIAEDYRADHGSFVLAVITDNTRRTLTSSFPEPTHLPLALNPDGGATFSHQQIGNSVFYQLMMPKRLPGHVAWIIVGQNLANPNVIVDDVLAGFAGQLIWIALPILAAIFLADIFLLRRMFRPVVAASEIAGSIQPDSAPARLPMLNLPREVLPLAEAFNQALERLEKALRAQREFTADAAHELRTPLAILRTEIDLALDSKTAHRLHTDVDTISHILDQLLELAELQGESLITETVDLRAVATETVSVMAPIAVAKGRILELFAPGGGAITSRGNHRMLSRALRNLIENAIRHTPRGGRVEVSVHNEGSIAITDEGPGIVPGERQLIFQRFWRRNADATEGGAGLGLAIVARIMELHGGKIEVSDSAAGGAKFTLILAQPARIGQV